MSDEMSDRTHYSSSGRKKSASGSTDGASKSTGTHGGGTVSGSRKADSPAVWANAPTRQEASARGRSFGKRVGW